MKHLSLFVRSALCVAALGLGVSIVSCGGDDTGGTTPDANTGTPDGGGTANSGTYNHYATNTLKIGSSPGEATALAFNIDGKPGQLTAIQINPRTGERRMLGGASGQFEVKPPDDKDWVVHISRPVDR